MFSCKKCGNPLYIRSAELKDRILKMEVSCIRGHKTVRRLADHQAQDMAEDLFDRIFVCVECGLNMTQMATEIDGEQAESLFLCPIHGPQKRDFPSQFLPAVSLLSADVDVSQSVVDSFRCLDCGQVYAISDIVERDLHYKMDVQCPNGHKNRRYVAVDAEEDLMKTIMQRVAHCDRCGLPGHITSVGEKSKIARLYASCPVHGTTKKDVALRLLPTVQEAVSEIPEDAIVKGMLVSSDCKRPLAIRAIEPDKAGYRFRTACPGRGQTTSRTLPVNWTELVSKRIAAAVLTCNECGHLTHMQDIRKDRKKVDFEIVCPIHGVMKRSTPPDVFEHISAVEPEIDRLPSVIRSLSCERCSMPIHVRDVEDRRGLTELDGECRNGHRVRRFFPQNLDQGTLVDLYKNLYRCPECYDQLDLVYAEPQGRESRVVLLCPVHGKYVLDIPHDHAKAMETAYDELEADKVTPPVEAPPHEKATVIESEADSPETPEDDVVVYRGCEVVGGKFDYKVKVVNDSGYVITNVTVSIVAYPKDCLETGGETVKTISRIEIDGFRSPSFTFFPTKDCVQGKIVATASYIDFRDQLHTLQVEPFIIRSVCDLLKPMEATSKQFDLVLSNLTRTEQEQALDWNAQILFTKAEKLLPAKNFHIVDSDEKIVGGQFIGTIRGYAEGKYTGKKVAVIFMITGPEIGRHATVKVEALGEDIAMLPTTIDELAETIDSWICLRCGAPLAPEEVDELGQREPIRCRYCAHTLTIALYLQ
ncbi:MAG: hypothetical protein JSW61_12110 [Candidatus Thorarchaeota archaeon]|nr:MAG: hypothetical protein JSW61_12110 [Candidatus Thorarchaeota archaeon]